MLQTTLPTLSWCTVEEQCIVLVFILVPLEGRFKLWLCVDFSFLGGNRHAHARTHTHTNTNTHTHTHARARALKNVYIYFKKLLFLN